MSDVELLHEIASSDFETVALSDSEEETTAEQIHVEREQLIVLLREFETLREDVVQATTENSQLQENFRTNQRPSLRVSARRSQINLKS